MNEVLAAAVLTGLIQAGISAAPSTLSPSRPDVYCSAAERGRTIARYEIQIADWREALADARQMGSLAAAHAAEAYARRFEDELRIARAAPVYRCPPRGEKFTASHANG